MKRIIAIVSVCVSLFFLGCQKELSFNNGGTSGTKDPVTATLQGNVVDENGNPAQGVNITVGSKTTITDAKGYFRIRNAALDKSASFVTAEKVGYFKTFRVFSASAAVNHIKIKMQKKTLTGAVNSSAGGAISLPNGSSVTFSANSFVKASGSSYSGTVNVYSAYIDPTSQDIGEVIPGSFLAEDKDGKRVTLASYAMMGVELESSAGEKLQIAAGSSAKLKFAIPSLLQSSAPNVIPLWYVDEKTGLWKEEGTASRSGNIYEGDVKHFTYWNCDVPGPQVNVTARFMTNAEQPLVHAHVWFRPASGGWGGAHGYTDSLGQISGPVPANVNLVLEVIAPSPCNNIIYSQNVGPYSANTNLGTITVNSTQNLLTVQGKLLKCNGSPVTNGFAEIQYDNMVRYASVNASGNYSVTFTTCGSSQPNCTIIGTDSQAGQQSQPVVVAVSLPATTVADITACGTSTLEFINYTLDGVSTNLANTNLGDQISASDTLGINNVSIYGSRAGFGQISFGFTGNGSPGTFPATHMLTLNYNNTTLILPFNVVITSYPATGGYFEGSFSGQFKDANNVTHNINGTFRVKRR